MRKMASFRSEHAYRFLLRVYPAEFRDDYGEEMVQFFRDRCREVRRAQGAAGLIGLWLHTLGDLASSALSEHIDSWEASMNLKTSVGVLLLLFALGNIVYDAVTQTASMGILAIFVTALAAALGGALVSRGKSGAAVRQ